MLLRDCRNMVQKNWIRDPLNLYDLRGGTAAAANEQVQSQIRLQNNRFLSASRSRRVADDRSVEPGGAPRAPPYQGILRDQAASGALDGAYLGSWRSTFLAVWRLFCCDWPEP